jgi:hypothetical protein
MVIDPAEGRVRMRLFPRGNEVPGTLLLAPGFVLSLNALELAAYPTEEPRKK